LENVFVKKIKLSIKGEVSDEECNKRQEEINQIADTLAVIFITGYSALYAKPLLEKEKNFLLFPDEISNTLSSLRTQISSLKDSLAPSSKGTPSRKQKAYLEQKNQNITELVNSLLALLASIAGAPAIICPSGTLLITPA
jgi:hypothetical protein